MGNYKLLDLFCKAGGASMGYRNAGFDVVGVDIEKQPNYPFEFIQKDALEILEDKEFIDRFDVVAASPPCQKYSRLKYLSGNIEQWDKSHVDLVATVREKLIKSKKVYVIENVVGAPLNRPITLWGSQFENLYSQRPRLFESNIQLVEPKTKMQRKTTPKLGQGFSEEDGYITIAGKQKIKGMTETQVRLYWGFALGGIDWMTRAELAEAIPPLYTEFVGKQLIQYLDNKSISNSAENIKADNLNIDLNDLEYRIRQYLKK